MAAELVETSRLWARDVVRIEPEWVEPLAGHLRQAHLQRAALVEKPGAVGRGLGEGHRSTASRSSPRRKVAYGRIDPELSRELFLRHALVEGDWRSHHRFLADNRALLEDVEELEHRARRRGPGGRRRDAVRLLRRAGARGRRLGRHFDAWWKAARRTDPDLLTFERAMLLTDEAAAVAEADYPRVEHSGGVDLRLDYAFEPGTAQDGVTVEIPLAVLNRVDADVLCWQVPGLRQELVTALIRSLPKELRRSFVPAPDTARAVLQDAGPQDGPLLDVLSAQLRRRTGVTVPPDAWDLDRVPAYLRPTYRVVEEDGSVLATGEDVEELRHRLAGPMRQALSRAGSGGGSGAGAAPESGGQPSRAGRPGGQGRAVEGGPPLAASGGVAEPEPEPGPERTGLRSWDGIGTIPRVWNGLRGGLPVTAYPALVDEGDTVAVSLLATPAEQARAMRAGTRRLLQLQLPAPGRGAVEHLGTAERLALSRSPHGGVPALLEDCAACAVDSLVEEAGGPAWDAAAFAALLEHTRAGLVDRTVEVVTVVARVLAAAGEVEAGVKATSSLVLLPALSDLRTQLAGLVHPGFVAGSGRRRLPDVLRYLRAAARRLEKLPDDPARDRRLMEQVQQAQGLLDDLVKGLPPSRRQDPAVQDVRWMVEELRVSLFAQTVGTPSPVSLQRIQRAVDRLRR